ncbi:DNA mismatch endonuclease Vsr [Collinsella vaginalis]|uniref:DNA mismatch endonuclease Vsr n=1 Tax=Collinsella vaginalis TaxID=1870987 RepID=UPI000A26D412|nr:DNA mismatch endonuclease Vsr [Collinsella vaginalis]
MRVVHVAAGVICRGDEVLCARRGYGPLTGRWEFPGGKVERHETAEEACRRELLEELSVSVTDLRSCYTVEYDYEDFHLSMECFLCELEGPTAEPVLADRQQDLRWVARADLMDLAWMDADVEFVRHLAAGDDLVGRRRAIRRSMKGNTRSDTKPELLVRQRLRAAGLTGYRLQWKKAPGRPDIAFPGRRVAIFVNGCFWHRCPRCSPRVPKRNTAFWEAKFARNQERDARALAELEDLGWTTIVIWECELKRDRVDETMVRVVERVRAAGSVR